MKMHHERRRTPRTAEKLPVVISDASDELQTETHNLSASGTYCTLNRFIAPMTKLTLQFELPNGSRRSRIRCSGVVVRTEPMIANVERGRYHVAILFTELAERDRSAIARFVTQRLTAPS